MYLQTLKVDIDRHYSTLKKKERFVFNNIVATKKSPQTPSR